MDLSVLCMFEIVFPTVRLHVQIFHSGESMSCAICLESWTHPVKLDGCFHTFCWTCALEWAKQSMTCPLCKKEFVSLLHSVDPETLHYQRLFLDKANIERYSNYETPPAPSQDTKRKVVYLHSLEPVVDWNKRELPFPCKKNEPRSVSAKREVIVNRLDTWTKRELGLLVTVDDEFDSEVEVISTLILTELERSGEPGLLSHGASKLEPFLHKTAKKFIVELLHFLTSPYTNPQQYDANVRYTSPNDPAKHWSFSSKPPVTSIDIVDLTSDTTTTLSPESSQATSDSCIVIDSESEHSDFELLEDTRKRKSPERSEFPEKKRKIEIVL